MRQPTRQQPHAEQPPPAMPPPAASINRQQTCGLSECTVSDCAYLWAAALRHSNASSGCCARTRRAMSVRATAQLSAASRTGGRSGAFSQPAVNLPFNPRQFQHVAPQALSRPAARSTIQSSSSGSKATLTQRRCVTAAPQAAGLHVNLSSLVQQRQAESELMLWRHAS